MSNKDLVNFFFFNNTNKFTIDKLKRETDKKYIYGSVRYWLKNGLLKKKPDRQRNEFNKKRKVGKPKGVYELTPKGQQYVRFKIERYRQKNKEREIKTFKERC